MWGARWSDERVEQCLVDAFRAMPGMGVYSPSHSKVEQAYGRPVSELTIVAACYIAIERDAEYGATLEERRRDLLMLLTWARVKGAVAEGAQEASLSAICREKNWPRGSFERRRRIAAARAAAWLARRAQAGADATA